MGLFRYFRPTLRSTGLLVAALALFLSLAKWQWQRAEEKRQLLVSYRERLQEPPLELDRIPLEAIQRYRRARVRGQLDLNHPLWLANRFLKGRLGYELLVPFGTRRGKMFILVNLGWTPLPSSDPKVLPAFPALPQGEIEIEGILDRFPALGLYLEGGEKIKGWPAVVSWLDQAELERALGKPVLAWQLKLDPKFPFGLERHWSLELSPPPERHVGYAFQWMAFAVVAVVLWIRLSVKRAR